MSVQNQDVKNVYAGNGSTTVFPYTFALNEDDGEYVGVYVTNDEGTSEETDNYTIDTTAKTVTYPASGDPLDQTAQAEQRSNEKRQITEDLADLIKEVTGPDKVADRAVDMCHAHQ